MIPALPILREHPKATTLRRSQCQTSGGRGPAAHSPPR